MIGVILLVVLSSDRPFLNYSDMIYKVGSRGGEVVKIQKAVGVGADGLYGNRTKEAVAVWQKAHGLTADGIVGYKTWFAMFGEDMPSKAVAGGVVYLPLNKHIKMLQNRDIKYLAIHFTAGSTSKVGSARNVRNVFLSREASADFAVDDAEMVQFNPDIRNYYCWAVGGELLNSGGCRLYGKARNSNTISIEICSNCSPRTNTALNHSNHDGWSFTEKELDNAVRLAKILMKKFNIPIDRVVRHYDITGKLCPGVMGWNDAPEVYDKTTGKRIVGAKNNSKEWEKFKARLK